MQSLISLDFATYMGIPKDFDVKIISWDTTIKSKYYIIIYVSYMKTTNVLI